MISASGMSFSYGSHLVLTDVSLTAGAGEVVGVIGPNGSGKSTLLRTLYAALRPRAGLICLDDMPVGSLAQGAVARRIGVVSQEPPSGISLTVADMVLLGRLPHRAAFERYTAFDRALAVHALREAGVEHLARRGYEELSGGEKQRVLIARALAQDTDHLLLDEPTNHLDIRERAAVERRHRVGRPGPGGHPLHGAGTGQAALRAGHPVHDRQQRLRDVPGHPRRAHLLRRGLQRHHPSSAGSSVPASTRPARWPR